MSLLSLSDTNVFHARSNSYEWGSSRRCRGPGAPGDRWAWPVITTVLRDSTRVTLSPGDLSVADELSRINPWSELHTRGIACTDIQESEGPPARAWHLRGRGDSLGIRCVLKGRGEGGSPFLTRLSLVLTPISCLVDLGSTVSQSLRVPICEVGLGAPLQLRFLTVPGTGVRQKCGGRRATPSS